MDKKKTAVLLPTLTLIVFCAFLGCDSTRESGSDSGRFNRLVSVSGAESGTAKKSKVLAQGRLQPAGGTLRISAMPGDGIEELSVTPGDSIAKGQTIARLQSYRLKLLELDAAQLKLEEAKLMTEVKRKEADLNIDTAKLKQQTASQQVLQAVAQQEQAVKGKAQLKSLADQIQTLERLRNDPETHAAIGSIELEAKKSELRRVELMNEQVTLSADQAVEISKLQLVQSERMVAFAAESRELIERGSSVASLEKQIEVLKEQMQQGLVTSPIDGVVLTINADIGERVSQFPIAELADLSKMVCMAEVHESEVGKVSKGDRVEMRSSALERVLLGTVDRIDRVVGAVQMRAPNPLARSDFRAVPVWITIDSKDAEIAASRLQLQVEVSISSVR